MGMTALDHLMPSTAVETCILRSSVEVRSKPSQIESNLHAICIGWVPAVYLDRRDGKVLSALKRHHLQAPRFASHPFSYPTARLGRHT
jgi:hypothetical protein